MSRQQSHETQHTQLQGLTHPRQRALQLEIEIGTVYVLIPPHLHIPDGPVFNNSSLERMLVLRVLYMVTRIRKGTRCQY